MLAYILHKHFLHKNLSSFFTKPKKVLKKIYYLDTLLCIWLALKCSFYCFCQLLHQIFFCLFFFCLPVFWAWTLCRGAVIRNTDVVTIKNDNSDPFTVTIVIWQFFSQFFSKNQKESTMIIVCRKAGNCPRSKVKYYIDNAAPAHLSHWSIFWNFWPYHL